jgi:glycosyltransferase involved in cell wall biosynthesis
MRISGLREKFTLSRPWSDRVTKVLKIFSERPAKKIRFNTDAVIICADENPSVDYFVKPFLSKKNLAATRVGFDERSRIHVDWQGVKLAVVVRYLPANWVRPLEAFRCAGGHIVYFMDDDLMDERSLVNLPTAYYKKIRRLATDQVVLIENLSAEFWVSSRFLAEKYIRWAPTILPARPHSSLLKKKKAVDVFYHGTASHQAELGWLVPVVKAVQERNPVTQFEVFGDLLVNRLYRDLPRVTVVHPMRWLSYLAYTSTVRRDIGLAPLMPEPFNAARAPTKFFDFVRMGAVGLYSDVPPYSDFIRSGVDGILLPNDPEAWAAAIIELVSNEERRIRMAKAAHERAMALAIV